MVRQRRRTAADTGYSKVIPCHKCGKAVEATDKYKLFQNSKGYVVEHTDCSVTHTDTTNSRVGEYDKS